MSLENPFVSQAEIGIVTTTELKLLLVRMLDTHSGTCLRPRLLGEMWHRNFLHLLMFTKTGVVILNDEVERRAITIMGVEDIVQFELDQKFENYMPHFHYEVKRF